MRISFGAALAAVCLTAALALPAARADPPPAADAYGDPLPPGAVARLGSARLRHAANALAWAPDGKTFASAGADGVVRVWDADDGKEVGRFKTATPVSFYSIVYLPDGKSLAAAGGDGVFRVWDLATGREVRTLTSAPLNGLMLASARLAPGPDEGTVVALGPDHVCRILDLTTGKALRQMESMRNVNAPMTQTALSPDGRRFAGWAPAPAADALTVWDTADGKELFHAPTSIKQISGLVFSPDGKTLAAYSAFTPPVVATWDVNTGKELRRYDGILITAAPAFSPNGKYLVARSGDSFIHLWGLASGKDLRQLDASSGGTIPIGGGAPAFSPDGKKLAASVGASIRVWDVGSGEELHEFTGHIAAVDEMRFTPDGRRLLSCGKDGSARLWDAASGKQLAAWTGPQGLLGMAPSPDAGFVVASSGSGLVRADLGAGGPMEKIFAPLPPGGLVPNFVLTPDGKTAVAAGPDRALRFWDLATGKNTASWPLPDPGVGNPMLAISPDGRTLATAAPTAPVRLWDVASARELRMLDTGAPPAQPGRFIPGPLWNVSHLVFSPHGRTLLCVTSSELSLWEVAVGRDRMRIARPAGNLTCATFSPDGGLIAAGTGFGTVVLLDAENGDELGERGEARGAAVTALAFAPDGKTLAAGGADGAIVIWDVKEWAGRPRPAAGDLKPEKLSALWKDLIDGDASRAYKAVLTLSDAPAASAPFLKERLAGAAGGDDKRIVQLVQQLNDDEFDVRESAQKELDKIGELALPALRKALDSNPPPETRRRAQEIMDKHKDVVAVTEVVRTIRAVEALERSGAAEAMEALRALAKDAPNAAVKEEASAALERLARRNATP